MPRHDKLPRGVLLAARLWIVLLCACCAPLPVEAGSRYWITSTGGQFHNDNHWSATDGGAGGATVPTTTDIAYFTLNNTYVVSFTGGVTNVELLIENGNVTFDLGGQTYTGSATFPIQVGSQSGQTGRLTVLEGTVAVNTAGRVVEVGGFGTGFLTVDTGGQVGTAGNRPSMRIGDEGTGTLTVQSDGQVFGTSFDVGYIAGSSGTVTVTGPQASLDATNTIYVGRAGTGTMTVSGGAEVASTSNATIGNDAGSSGTVTITGAGSEWTQSGTMTVGSSGVGTLNVQSGGALVTSDGIIGSLAGSFGTANVSGTGSIWTLSNELQVGGGGEGVMNVTSGGRVAIASDWIIADGNAGQGTATVSGAGSRVDVTDNIGVGLGGSGRLTISSGGQVTSAGAGSYIGFSISSSGEVTITGAGSSWTTTGDFTVGLFGAASGTITVENGGSLDVGGTMILDGPTGTLNLDGGTISAASISRVAGAAINWTDGTLSVVGGSFDNGGTAFAINGADADDRPTLRLTSSSTTLASQMGNLTVGNDRGAALEVTGGSVLQVPSISIGAADGGDGIVTVSGNNSLLIAVTSNINVGGTDTAGGGAGALNIETGAVASTATAGQLRLWAGGTVNVNGGTLIYGTLAPNGGQVNFNAGRIEQNSGLTANESALTALLGATHVLGTGRTLSAGSFTATVSANLDINGGRLEGSNLSVTSAGGSSTIVYVRGGGVAQFIIGATIGATSRMFIDDGTLNAGTALTQQGELQLSSTSLVSGALLQNTGLISGSGRVDADLNNQSAGQVRIAAGQQLVFRGSPNSNDGLIDVNGGEAEFALGPLTNSTVSPSTGLIAARDATLRFSGGLTNNGAMTFTSGVSEVFGDITNANVLTTPGRIVVSGGAHANFYDDVANNGTIQVSAAGTFQSTVVFLGSLSGNGVSGGGHVFVEGDVRPGLSPATMAFGGDLSFGPSATLEIELAGTTPGTQFDRVTVADELALGGALDVTLLGSFTPVAGNSFDVLDWASLAGTFDMLRLPVLGADLMWNTSQLYTTGELSVVSAGLPGDYNDDGTVDAADYVVWRKNEGTSNALSNDPIGGTIGQPQYDQWSAHFGKTAGSGSSSNATVPEPGSAILLILGAAIGSCTRRRIVSRAPLTR
jgi:T5SS/PEP-CTERM-associated repeat protein